MKTTLDLPADLVKELKLRAVHNGQKLKDTATEVIRRGLSFAEGPAKLPLKMRSRRVKIHPRTGLPVVVCGKNAPASKMTVEALIALEHDTQTQVDIERFGISN